MRSRQWIACAALFLACGQLRAGNNDLLKLAWALEQKNGLEKFGAQDLQTLANGPQGDKARQMVRNVFIRGWLDSPSQTKQDVKAFLAFASGLQAFGNQNADLPGVLAARPRLPAAAANEDFLSALRTVLPPGAVAGELLPALGKGTPGEQDIVNRFRFLKRLARGAEEATVAAAFEKDYWKPASALHCANYIDSLSADAPEERAIQTELADRVYAMPAGDWAALGERLPCVAKGSQYKVRGFFEKAAALLRADPHARTSPNAATLTRLCQEMNPADAAEVLGLTVPNCLLEWFLWCHQSDALVARLLKDDATVRSLTHALVRFAQPGDDASFLALFPVMRDRYYLREPAHGEVRNELFSRLLLPKVQTDTPGRKPTLEAALGGTWTEEHRETLASHVLREGKGDQPAWSGASIDSLKFASEIYRSLSLTSPQQHINRPLLSAILKEHLLRFRQAGERGSQAENRAEQEFLPLLNHLREVKGKGADFSRSPALQEFNRFLPQTVLEALDALHGAATREAEIKHFIRRLKIALKVDRLLCANVGGQPAEWFDTVCSGMREKVFKLPPDADYTSSIKPGGEPLRVDPALLPMQSDILADLALDKDFRDVAAAGGIEDRLFNSVFLPLVRVPGLLKRSRGDGQTPWPHLEWAKGKPHRQGDFFKALNCPADLDARDAVLDMAGIHLQEKGWKSAWAARPEAIFAAQWSRNCSPREYRKLLEKTPPRFEEALDCAKADLRAHAQNIVAHWDLALLTREEQWEMAEWTENLVTASEWQRHPFVTGTQACSWSDPVARENPDAPRLPFQFTPPPGDNRLWKRTVDGSLRESLLKILIKTASQASPTEAQLALLSRTAIILPNQAENSATADAASFDAAKVETARLLHTAIAATQGNRTEMLRGYIRVCASLSTPPGLEGGARGVLPGDLKEPAALLATAEKGPPETPMENESLREEFRRLLQSRQAVPAASEMDETRREIDAILGTADKGGTLLPREFRTLDRDLLCRSFHKRLAGLKEPAVRDFLRLNRQMRRLLGLSPDLAPAAREKAQGPSAVDAGDIDRAARFFYFIDWLTYYSRPDWKKHNGWLAHELPTDEGGWWPALTMLCACTPEFQDECERWLRAVPKEEARELATCLILHHEAAMGTLGEIAAIAQNDPPRAARMLNFQHTIVWEEVNLRVLAIARMEEKATAKTFAENAFYGVARSPGLASILDTPPKPGMLERRIFESMDALLPEKWWRGEPICGLDGAVRLAAGCATEDKLPEPLRKAAPKLLEAASSSSGSLLEVASTAGEVVEVLFKLAAVSAKKKPGAWRDFFDCALTAPGKGGKPVLNPAVGTALAEPFFRQPAGGQRAGIEQIVAKWRGALNVPPPPDASRLVTACREGWARRIDDLIRGKGRKDASEPFLWEPVERLNAEAQSKAELPRLTAQPPRDFLETVAWFQSLWRDDDPEPIRRYFDPFFAQPAAASREGPPPTPNP